MESDVHVNVAMEKLGPFFARNVGAALAGAAAAR
jgi:hypothetical protein